MKKNGSLRDVLVLALIYIAGTLIINLLRNVSGNNEGLVEMMNFWTLGGGALFVLSCIIHLITLKENSYSDCSTEKTLDSHNAESHGEYDVGNDTFCMNTMTWD